MKIQFEDMAKYMENVLNETTYALYNNTETVIAPDGSEIETIVRKISHLYTYKIFYDSGDIIHPDKELPEGTIAVNIINDGVVQDSSTPITAYLQSIQMQFLSREEYREDLALILKDISVEYKAKLDTLDNTPIQTSIDEFASFSEREFKGQEYFTGELDVDFILWEQSVLSNAVKIYLGDEAIEENELKYSTFGSKRTINAYSDLRKYAEVPFSAENSTWNVSITGIFTNTELLKKIRSDHYLNNNFGNKYTMIIKDELTNETFKKELLLISSEFYLSFGQNSTYSLTFTTYGDLI